MEALSCFQTEPLCAFFRIFYLFDVFFPPFLYILFPINIYCLFLVSYYRIFFGTVFPFAVTLTNAKKIIEGNVFEIQHRIAQEDQQFKDIVAVKKSGELNVKRKKRKKIKIEIKKEQT